MSILMVHDQHENAHVAIAEGIVGGEKTPVRRYQQEGQYLSIDPPANAREHDMAELHKLGYRLATPNEQNMYAKQQKQSKTLQETNAAKGDK